MEWFTQQLFDDYYAVNVSARHVEANDHTTRSSTYQTSYQKYLTTQVDDSFATASLAVMNMKC